MESLKSGPSRKHFFLGKVRNISPFTLEKRRSHAAKWFSCSPRYSLLECRVTGRMGGGGGGGVRPFKGGKVWWREGG